MSTQFKLLLAEFVTIAILMAVIWHTGILGHISITAVILAMLGINFFILQIISKRIQNLHAVINAVSRGSIDKRAKVESHDEISKLAKDLNTMIESLVEARRLPENILRSMKDGLFVVDIKGNISEANQAILKMLGYAKEELIGKPISTIFVKQK